MEPKNVKKHKRDAESAQKWQFSHIWTPQKCKKPAKKYSIFSIACPGCFCQDSTLFFSLQFFTFFATTMGAKEKKRKATNLADEVQRVEEEVWACRCFWLRAKFPLFIFIFSRLLRAKHVQRRAAAEANLHASIQAASNTRRQLTLLAIVLSLLAIVFIMDSTSLSQQRLMQLHDMEVQDNIRKGRPHVALKFMSSGNAAGVTFTQWLFLPGVSDDEFKRAVRVSRATFAYLEAQLTPELRPQPGSFRADTLSAREKIVMALYFMGSRGTCA